jgi:glycosyltransferase involved in cell wall biosynthesis
VIRACLMLRDEAHCIARTLHSVAPYVDSYCVLDTGSTDGTPELVRATMTAHDVPGVIIVEPFVDYAATRNRLLDLASAGTDDPDSWLLMLDAEDELVHGDSLRFLLQIARPSSTCWQLQQRWPDGYVVVPRVVRAGTLWRYVGKVHELLTHPGGEPPEMLIGPWIRHVPTAIGQARSRARWPRDVEILQRELEERPDNWRLRWHLDRTLAALARAPKVATA